MFLMFLGGLVLGVVGAYLVLRPKWLVRDAKLADIEKQNAEKIQVLKSAEEALSNSFKALSAEALQRNNQSFLDLAKTQLEKYQEGARADLGKKQDAIFEVIKPVKERMRYKWLFATLPVQ